MNLTAEQYAVLTTAINPSRVRELNKQHHVEAWDIRRYLIRVFGFGGFDIDTKDLHLVREIEIPSGSKSRWTVIYRAEVRLTIKDAAGNELAHYEDAAMGDSQNQPVLGSAHDQAMKTALSQALKRCAVNLGDQFGLSLYNKGSAERAVVRSVVAPEDSTTDAAMPDDAPVVGGELDEATSDESPAAEPVAEVFPAPVLAISANSTPGEIRTEIKAAGEAKSLTIMEIAEDFHEWSKGEQIGQAKSDVLFEYLQHLTEQRAA